ncbi:MAG: bacillithiol biosynthesis BshC, partial [Saprospiraceae bacterium]|nr:bacillithiol biosynthesis BshC [Saprospiraceae bacterium]
MKLLTVPYKEVEQFSATDIAFSQQSQALQAFAKYSTDLNSFEQVIADKQKDPVDRNLLYEVVKAQYQQYITDTNVAQRQIEKLKDANCFTIITAHQPVLFTGPAYVAYKIISAIKLAEDLCTKFPAFQFVPVFVTGGEDHDFEEMDHMTLYGKSIKWESEETGSVGRMSTKSLQASLKQLEEILGNSPVAQEVYKIFADTHT